MDLALVYSKTAKGLAEVKSRSGSLSLQARRVLIMIDGKRPVGEIEWVVRGGELETILDGLKNDGLIEATSSAENVVNAAQAAIAAAAEMTEQWQATVPMVPRTPDSIVPRPETLGGVRPGTIRKDAAPTTLSEALLGKRPATVAEAATARPGTMTGSSPARPGTMTGVSPVRPTTIMTSRPATLGSTAQTKEAVASTASGNSAAAIAHAAVAPATQAASPVQAPAAKPAPSLDETKNLAVRELYQRLGPYGEAPAKNIRECTTLDGLREQIKVAGRRVASLRGDKAAQEYLSAVGQL